MSRSALPPLPPHARLRWDVVRRLLPSDAARVLEVGCGQGAVGARLARRYPSYLGVDPDETSAAVARARLAPAGGEVRVGTVPAVLGDAEQFDLVCAFEVLEHLPDDTGMLRGWHDRLRPGGTVVVSMPAWPERFNAWDSAVGHLRRYTPDDAADLLRRAGLVDVRVVVYGWPLGYALERVRAALRRGRASDGTDGHDGRDAPAELTAASGRVLQPRRAATGLAVAAAVAPFALLQRAAPRRGTGLVATGRRPRDGGGSVVA